LLEILINPKKFMKSYWGLNLSAKWRESRDWEKPCGQVWAMEGSQNRGRPNSIKVVSERALPTLSVCPSGAAVGGTSPSSTHPPDPWAVKYKRLISQKPFYCSIAPQLLRLIAYSFLVPQAPTRSPNNCLNIR
jgi:hypothetical protein